MTTFTTGSSTRKFVILSVIFVLVALAVGILIGYFAIERNDGKSNGKTTSLVGGCKNGTFNVTLVERYQQRCDESICGTDCLCKDLEYPKNYIAYHLNGKSITIDGRLDDDAWREVPWSSDFVDLRGDKYPTPRFETKFKMRWDDNRLFVGAFLEDRDIYGTFENPDDLVFFDDAIEVFYDADNSLHNYKEVQVNPKNTFLDLLLKRAYMYANGEQVDDISFSSGLQSAVYTDGVVADPDNPGTFWSVEMSMSFQALAENTSRTNSTPNDGEVLFMNVGRPDWKLNVVNGSFEKTGNAIPDADWWSWQETGAINLHVPGRWGAVQFSRDIRNNKFNFTEWHVYKALFDVAETLQVHRAIFGIFVDDLLQLAIPKYLLSEKCVRIPTINLTTNANGDPDFLVTIQSKLVENLSGTIRADKLVKLNR